MKIEQGTCIYCGQIQQIEVEDGVYLTEEDLNRRATSSCTCTEAKKAQDSYVVRTRAEKNIEKLFHEDRPEMERILLAAVEYMQDGLLDEIVLKEGGTKAKMVNTTKGNIKIEREKKTRTMLGNE